MDIKQTGFSGIQQTGGKFSNITSSTSGMNPKDTSQIGGKRDDGLEDLRKNIESMESMYAMMKKFGNGAKADQIKASIDKKKKMLEEAKNAPPPPQITDELKSKISDFITGKGQMPTELDSTNQEQLKSFASLIDNGMAFSDRSYQDMKPEDAFGKLIGTRYQGMDNQVMYKTYEGGMIAMSTLRTEYLKSLDHFVKYSKKGYVFYEKKDQGYQPLKTAREFIQAFQDNPDEALVIAADGTLVKPDKAMKIKAEQELRQLIPDDNKEKPEIIQKEDTVIIGGVVLKKRK